MTPSPISLSDLRRTFVDPPAEARPMVRWWWFGPDATRADIDRDLTAMAAAGIGGAEVAFEYPLSERPRRFGSPEFLADLAYAAERAGELGLRFALTLGSGWSFGGPHIGPEHAARKIHWERREIGPDAFLAPRNSGWPHDELIGAYVGAGSLQEDPDSYDPVPLTEDQLQVPPGVGPRVLLTATSRLTGQNVKRAAYGAEGPVHDHYSAAATLRHLDVVARPMVEAVGAERITSVFCDSLEVYAADWTPGLADLFAARRGYRPEPKLWLLASEHTEAAAFRSDFYRTLSELYEENFLVPMADWAHERGLKLRVQSYGEPPAALSSYRHVDLVEGEQWGWTGLPMTKWASSAASHLGVGVVSSETWTWVHAPSFRATPLDLKGEAYQHALSGINQFIGHGWPCRSSAMAEGLGWLFYASGAFDDRNAWWPAMPSLMRDLQRLSWVLRQGTPVRDVLLYLPTDDAYAAFGPSIDLFTVSTGLIPPEVPRALREGGYDYDLVDDYFLDQVLPDASTIVVLPDADVRLRDSVRRRLDAVRAAGGQVLVVGDGEPGEAAAALLRDLAAIRPADVVLDPPTPDVGAVHRWIPLPAASPSPELSASGVARATPDADNSAGAEVGGAGIDAWFVANTGPELRELTVSLRASRANVEVWDLASGSMVAGSMVPGDVGRAGVRLTLHPYQGVLLVGHDDTGVADDPAVSAAWSSVALGEWRLQRASGEDLGAVELPHRWEEDARIGPDFSGTMGYAAQVVELPATGRLRLDFGAGERDDREVVIGGMENTSYRTKVVPPVREVVEVLVDGQAVGVVWAAPWRIDLGPVGVAVREGSTITLRVSNTTSNALAADDTIAQWAGRAERLHGRRFRMQALDRALHGISSGLIGSPVLLVSRSD